jgi:ribosomal protein S12 methylthiotransferase
MKKIGFISLGCPKNLVDSEVMMGRLRQDGYEITDKAEEADTVVVNTCGFIESAKKESVEAILEAARLKEEGNCSRLVVAGCLVERYRDDLHKELPEVDAFIGTNQINEITSACETSVKTLPVVHNAYLYDESSPRMLATPGYFAYVKIAEGCDRPCSFCAIPIMRGSFRSRRFGSVMEEARRLASQGIKEIILIAQDSSRYGEDLGLEDGLSTLLRELSQIEEIHWVRVMYTFPTHISDGFLDVLAREPKAVKYLDLPLQHAATNVLKRMRRGGTRESLQKLIERVRSRVPGIGIRTTFIVGFPGETEEDFQELVSFVKEVKFDRVGVFTYSDEEQTHAYTLQEKVDPKIAKKRGDHLMKVQARIAEQKNRALIGSRLKVLFEGPAKDTDLLWQGRLETQAPDIDGTVLINDSPEGFQPEPGDLVEVVITEAHTYDLVGRIVQG